MLCDARGHTAHVDGPGGYSDATGGCTRGPREALAVRLLPVPPVSQADHLDRDGDGPGPLRPSCAPVAPVVQLAPRLGAPAVPGQRGRAGPAVFVRRDEVLPLQHADLGMAVAPCAGLRVEARAGAGMKLVWGCPTYGPLDPQAVISQRVALMH